MRSVVSRRKHQVSRFETYGHCEMTSILPDNNRWRFYRIEVMPGLFCQILSRAWGRIGCNVHVKEEFYDSVDNALRRANELYSIKSRRGYQEVDSIRAPELLFASQNHPGRRRHSA